MHACAMYRKTYRDGGQRDRVVPVADGLPNADITKTGECADVASIDAVHRHAVKVVVHKELRDAPSAGLLICADKRGRLLSDQAVLSYHPGDYTCLQTHVV